jgi:predicted enzyme related to lactoylglutathione lyase
MARVIGIGGIFFKSADPAGLMAWYKEVLGLDVSDWGGAILRPETMANHPGAATVFSPFKQDTTYFDPSNRDFMINLAVDDLDGVLASCRRHGVEPVKLMLEEANGKFAHIVDPQGMKLELWEPKPMT